MKPHAITPDRVDLRVVDDGGTAYPLSPDTVPGTFEATLVPRRGERYRLIGTIDGRAVTAQTIVPQTFAVQSPAGDTITNAAGAPCRGILPRLCVPYTFAFQGPPGFEYRVSLASGQLESVGALRSYEGELVFLRGAEVRTVAVLAYNAEAAEWLLRSTPRTNIAGAFGGFGAALIERRKLFAP